MTTPSEAVPIPESTYRRALGVALLTFIVIFGATWIWVWNERLAYLDFNYPTWLAKMELVQQGRTGDVTILGDSTPNADLLPERIGPGVVNLAVGGGTPVEAYYQLKKIVAGASPPKAVILSYSPADLVMPDFFWPYSVGFGLLSPDEVEEVRAQSRALGDASLMGPVSPGDIDVRLKAQLYALRFPSFYFPSLIQGRIWGRYAGNSEELKHVMADRGHAYYGISRGSLAMDNEVALHAFVPTRIIDNYFNRTLALLQAHKIPVYFITMPHNEASAAHYYPGLREDFAAYLDRYAQRYPNFHVLGDPLPLYPSRFFGDAWHLNEEGAPQWSDTVAGLLNEADAPGAPFGPN